MKKFKRILRFVRNIRTRPLYVPIAAPKIKRNKMLERARSGSAWDY